MFKDECDKIGAIFNELNVSSLNYEERNRILAGSICLDLGIIKDLKSITVAKSFPARFEIVERDPLVIIDGAHNVSKIQSTVYNLNRIKYYKLSAVISISADKNWKAILKVILPKIDILYVTKFNASGRTCVNPKEIMDFALAFKKEYEIDKNLFIFTDPIQTFIKAKENLENKDILLVTGSFYLAGNIRKLYCPEEKILEQRNSNI